MKPPKHRWSIAALSLALASMLLGAAPASPPARTSQLVILSTTDVKGKNEPCGCHTPKGGLSRRASFRDSLAREYDHLLLVDNGGFFPDEADSLYRDKAVFMMDGMMTLGTDAVGLGERELKYGRGWLMAQVKRTRLPITSANVWDTRTKKTLLPPYLVLKEGDVKVGVFSLTRAETNLGPSRDSLRVEDPAQAATRVVAELRKKGATVVVLLSQLGKVESEDLVTTVDGIDVVIAGRDVPMLQKGRLIKSTVACYGGDQGHYVGRTLVTLGPDRRMQTGENDVFTLGPEVPEHAAMLRAVKQFNDEFNERARRLEKERAVRAQASAVPAPAAGSADHFVGAQVCQRCHEPEYQQWSKTAHARAWQTLVDVNRESTAECVSCHVVGYREPGGFTVSEDALKLGNVQCENCHGMGTKHEAMAAASARVQEETCRTCHTPTTSPVFDFAVFQPHVLHRPPAHLPPLPASPAQDKMKAAAGH